MIIYELFKDMLSRPHLLIAGATGTGKSVLLNGLIYTALQHGPDVNQFILIDPKCVELSQYKRLPHCIAYGNTNKAMINALQLAMDTTEKRLRVMERRGEKQFTGPKIMICVDEFADLLTTCRKETEPIFRRICQIGRAAKVGLIACTQRPTGDVINPRITVNMDCRVGLRTINRRQSQNIIWSGGCELLPDPLTEHVAQCYYLRGPRLTRHTIPFIRDETIQETIDYWTK